MTRKVTSLPVTEKTVCETNADQKRISIDRIVLHTIVGTADSADHRFNDCSSKVSAHYGVLETGEIWHWVDEDWVAYHAGDYPMNQRSIGIEHEDNGDYNGVRPDALYTSSARLVADICKFYEIPCDRQHILKHSEVVNTQCPDALDVDRIVNEALQIVNPPVNPVITNQTELDLTGYVDVVTDPDKDLGILEFQSLKSKIKAWRTSYTGLAANTLSLNKEISDLQNQPPVVTTKIIYKTETFPAFIRRIFHYGNN